MSVQNDPANASPVQTAYRDFAKFREHHLHLSEAGELAALALADTRSIAADKAAFDLVVNALQADGSEGWARFRSGVRWNANAQDADFADLGPPLRAEWIDKNANSTLLIADPDKPGHLLLHHFTSRTIDDESAAESGERVFLRTTEYALGNRKHLQKHDLAYHVYFGTRDGEDPSAITRVLSLFAGFIPAKEEVTK